MVYNENIRLNAEKGFKSKLRKSGSWEYSTYSLQQGEFELNYKLREKNATKRQLICLLQCCFRKIVPFYLSGYWIYAINAKMQDERDSNFQI